LIRSNLQALATKSGEKCGLAQDELLLSSGREFFGTQAIDNKYTTCIKINHTITHSTQTGYVFKTKRPDHPDFATIEKTTINEEKSQAVVALFQKARCHGP